MIEFGIWILHFIHWVGLVAREPWMGGGTIPRCFATVSDNSRLAERKLSPSAPDRRECRSGLNVEGWCKSRKCAALCQMVIHPQEFKLFKLFKDGDMNCPKCQSNVKPITCGFAADEESGSIKWNSLMIIVKPMEKASTAMLVPIVPPRFSRQLVCATVVLEIPREL
ncbi:hypothetical protein JG688_00018150 [Phytophthora aleatoria]|uniref:Uncharacterized protein n=1 Tax=Phytophthora aleatoria TaxID=2496075 RepID=A0A8J5I990_9STRA|nr:hypothetical protein JG688_00018150 [Phytophthora aleatoria]